MNVIEGRGKREEKQCMCRERTGVGGVEQKDQVLTIVRSREVDHGDSPS